MAVGEHIGNGSTNVQRVIVYFAIGAGSALCSISIHKSKFKHFSRLSLYTVLSSQNTEFKQSISCCHMMWMVDVSREVIQLCSVKIELTPHFIRAEWSCRVDLSGSLELLHQAVHVLTLTLSILGFTLVAHSQEPCSTPFGLLLALWN